MCDVSVKHDSKSLYKKTTSWPQSESCAIEKAYIQPAKVYLYSPSPPPPPLPPPPPCKKLIKIEG